MLALSVTVLALALSIAPADAAKKKAVVVAVAAQPVVAPTLHPSPPEIVAAAPAADWVAIDPNDLMVMELAPGAKGKPRRVVIQLMPAPFSQGWVGNIRKLVAAKFWDGTSVYRVQDNYVAQWGDAESDDPKKAKAMPEGLVSVPESAYVTPVVYSRTSNSDKLDPPFKLPLNVDEFGWQMDPLVGEGERALRIPGASGFSAGWPVGYIGKDQRNGKEFGQVATMWPIHCYGMVGVGRNLSPDTGTGAELYTVIGHAPRHLDRNIALIGRVIEGMEHLSSLPRGTGPLGFYESVEERTPILSVRIMSQMAQDKPFPEYEYLGTESASFAKYADARANRRDPFFIRPAGGADICNIPVPVRRRVR